MFYANVVYVGTCCPHPPTCENICGQFWFYIRASWDFTLHLVAGQKQQESPGPFCHLYQLLSYLRACHSLSRRTAASRLKPSSSSSSSDTLRSPLNFAWHGKPGSNGDRRPPILTGRSLLLAQVGGDPGVGDTQPEGMLCHLEEKKHGGVFVSGVRPQFALPAEVEPGAPRPGPSPHLQASASALQQPLCRLQPISEAGSALVPPFCPQTPNQTPDGGQHPPLADWWWGRGCVVMVSRSDFRSESLGVSSLPQ